MVIWKDFFQLSPLRVPDQKCGRSVVDLRVSLRFESLFVMEKVDFEVNNFHETKLKFPFQKLSGKISGTF